MKSRVLLLIVVALTVMIAAPGFAADKLRIGVTLHPYYSWVGNIVGDTAEVVPVVPPEADPHSYQPRPQDLARFAKLDAVVVNGLGHDEFIRSMLKAADDKNIKQINPNQGLPLIPVFRKVYAFENNGNAGTKVSYNSHTYIAITGAIQQINTLARELGKLRPEHAELYRKNARKYAKKLRLMLGDALDKINELDSGKLKIATVHDGYAYLLQELGVEASAVIQPRHGIEPSAKQLQDTINQIKEAGVTALFTEMDFQKKYVKIIYEETGCRVYQFTHVSGGPYNLNKFEADMQKNLDAIVQAMRDAQ
ncbi:MAG: zinc ABC transporter substrate-binding protein [Candidatus Lernaella stagnicola]|nr:zinc ABC transporter substrate-binding protein [Candidatus Lernaella stagnicola]